MRKQSIICVLRVAYIDKIPVLMSLLDYLAGEGYQIDLIFPKDPHFTDPIFKSRNIRSFRIKTNDFTRRSLRVPVTLKLLAKVFSRTILSKPKYYLSGDKLGGIIAYLASRITRVPQVLLSLELPSRRNSQSIINILERLSIKKSKYFITYDDEHVAFICEETGAKPEQALIIPNTRSGTAKKMDSHYLREKFGISQNNLLILHSGGIGPWFDSHQLARTAKSWPESWRLVFHTSWCIPDDPYFLEFKSICAQSNVIIHNEPTTLIELDKIISSADIGIALYSRERLGYRADLMGMASGKIGDYLKNGIPVIATAIPSIERYINKYKCGIMVNSQDEIRPAIEKIQEQYSTFSDNAVRCFNELWRLEPYCETIRRKLH